MRSFLLLLALVVCIAPARAQRVTVYQPSTGGGTTISGAPTFTPLHTYYISPTGNDGNSGLTPALAWASPNHSVVCGDVIIAAPGAYTNSYSVFGNGNWGTVSSCPSTSGGIDGTGGIYFAVVLCGGSNLTSCTISGQVQEGVRVGQSNWAVEGFNVLGGANGYTCFAATSETASVVRHHIAFINDVASNCSGNGFDTYAWQSASGVDQQAVVGVIAQAASQMAGLCDSGISLVPANGPDSSAGTHVFVAGAFSYANINGFCGANSNGSGSYTTASAAASVGATSISVAATTNWSVDMPIGDVTANATLASIPAGTYITSITGTGPYTIGLSKAIVAPGVASGDNIAAMTSTDGEGIIFDSWSAYSYQGVVEQSLLWGNGSAGFEMFCNGTCQGSLKVYFNNNTIYGNNQDPKHNQSGFEFWPLQSPTSFTATGNLFQATVTKPPSSVYNTTSQTGYPVVAYNEGATGHTETGNYAASAASATCPQYATCDANSNYAFYNGADYSAGNTFGTSPGFASPTSLPTSLVNCANYSAVTSCMAGAGVIAAMKPSGGAAALGYQPPGPCAADALYPAWLKGIVHLSWNGTSVVEQPGLITKPCGM